MALEMGKPKHKLCPKSQKFCYPSHRGALIEAGKILATGRHLDPSCKSMSAYKCKCGWYHLTTNK